MQVIPFFFELNLGESTPTELLDKIKINVDERGKKIDLQMNILELTSRLVSRLIEGIAQNTTVSIYFHEDGGNVGESGFQTEKAILQKGASNKRVCVCGVVLSEKLKEEIILKKMKDQVYESDCLQEGDLNYVGNLTKHRVVKVGQVCRYKYCYVIAFGVADLLDHHIMKSEIVEKIWNGWGVLSVEKATTQAIEKTILMKMSKKDANISNEKLQEQWKVMSVLEAVHCILLSFHLEDKVHLLGWGIAMPLVKLKKADGSNDHYLPPCLIINE